MPTQTYGRDASTPWQMPWPAWKQVALRTWKEAGSDNVGLIAAGVAFYGFLALVPLLGAIVLSYGLVAEPATVIRNVQGLTSVMPTDAAKLVGEQLMNVVQTSDGKKGLGLLLALGLALFGARNGAGALITALNVAYEEEEKRGFIRLNLLTLAMTAAAVVVAIFAVIAIAALGHLQDLISGMPAVVAALGKVVSYALLLLVGAAGAATLYRFGPSRRSAQWAWLTPGSLFSSALWLLLTLGFGIYVANFGNYNATYGSLGAVVVLLTWLYLSSYILLFGAELNSELEHQTATDTTVGEGQPRGNREAWSADNVAEEGGTPVADAGPPNLSDEPARRDNSDVSRPFRDTAVEILSARMVNRIGRRNVGLVTTLFATEGLSKLRSRDRTAAGFALLAAAGMIAWLGRPIDPTAR